MNPRQDEFDNMSDQEFQARVELLIAEALEQAVESRHIGVYGAQKLHGSDVS
jgi:hypothetical protein